MVRKLCSILLVCALAIAPLFSTAYAGVVPVEEAETLIEQMELERAVTYGFATEEWLAQPDAAITHSEMCAMLDQLVEMADADLSRTINGKWTPRFDWKWASGLAAQSTQPMTRDDAAMALYLAAQAIWCNDFLIDIYPDEEQIWGSTEGRTTDADFPLWRQEVLGAREILCKIPGTGVTGELESTENTINAARDFVSMRYSLVTGLPVFYGGGSYSGQAISRRDAALAVVRLTESEANLLDDNRYIRIDEAGTYDKSIITDELLAAPSTLPEPVVDGKLTGEWKGAGTSARKDGRHLYKDFQESDIAFLADQGFNFSRIFFGFSSLRYPDDPADMMLVNEAELKDLDQLIAWGIEYGVHIQISMSVIDTPNGILETLDLNDEEWSQVAAYWKALARRYADIPAKYLSFDLFNELEPSPQNIPYALKKVSAFLQDMRTENPERLIMTSFTGAIPNMHWIRGAAQIGLSLGCHPYRPVHMTNGYVVNDREVDVGRWPYPYFPWQMEAGDEYTIEGDIGGKKLTIDLWYCNDLIVDFDNGETVEIDVSDTYVDGEVFSKVISIPENVQRIAIRVKGDTFVQFRSVGITKRGITDWLMVHDWATDGDSGNAELKWTEAEGWTSEKYYTAEEVFAHTVLPQLKIAEEYGVYLMVNEFGVFSGKASIEATAAYTKDMVRVFEENGISWCLCETEGWPYRFLTVPYGAEYIWDSATLETVYYVFEDGHARKMQYCTELLEALGGN